MATTAEDVANARPDAEVASLVGEHSGTETLAGESVESERHEFGPENLRAVSYAELNLVSQMRKLYEAEPLEELAASIDLRGLMHQLTVAELTPERCEEYLEGINSVWKSEHSIDELTPNVEGNYYIVIAGHRRYLAIGKLMEEHQWATDSVDVVSNIHSDIVPYEALKRQLSENVMAPPKPYEFAYAIRELYEAGLIENRFHSVAAFARELEFKEDKVRSAVRYCMLPGRVRELVESGALSYSASIELVPLLQAYLEREEDDEIITEQIYNVAVQALLNGWNQEKMRQIVAGRVDSLRVQQLDVLDILYEGAEQLRVARLAEIKAERRQMLKEFSREGFEKFNTLLYLQDRGLVDADTFTVLHEDVVREELRRWSLLVHSLIERSGYDMPEAEAATTEVDAALDLHPGEEVSLFK